MKKNIKNTLLLLILGATVAVVGYKYTQVQQDQPIFTTDVVQRG
ncbi:MAG TPA: efflux transporter periplasmic adaptor subunit, partial [Shewanella baltica]|nr:efflux transporter periplasmic adaptor subunit [Shewanella baltica]